MKRKVVLGFLGTQLDSGLSTARWEKWRPTISLAQHDDLAIDQLILMYDAKYSNLATCVKSDFLQLSPNTDVRLTEMNLANPWDFGEVYGVLYDWIKTFPFDPEHEEYWVHITTGTHVAQICLFLLVEARFIPGVLLQSAPPRGRQGNGIGSYELIDLDLSKYDAISSRLAIAQVDAITFLKSGIATRNSRFNQTIEEVERVAVSSKAPILLTGPTGAGKSMLAKRIFELKKSRHQITGSFTDVNCATLRGDGAGSALFGHKKGSFTGAGSDRSGLLRTADQGILFLDEIGELGLDEQAMLLTAIENKRFLPLGSDKEVQSNFQLIAGTNKDLRIEVGAGRFRDDLFARINLWTYTLPGLADRREDIEPNINHQLAIASQDLGKKIRFTTEAKHEYLRFAQSPEALWSGNFRDLISSITRLATLADNGRIGTSLVEAEKARLRWQWQSGSHSPKSSQPIGRIEPSLYDLLGESYDHIDYFERLQLHQVVRICLNSNSLSEAGRTLFDISRTKRDVINDADRLRKYLLKFDLSWEKICEKARFNK